VSAQVQVAAAVALLDRGAQSTEVTVRRAAGDLSDADLLAIAAGVEVETQIVEDEPAVH
jgi:hypothetical protein